MLALNHAIGNRLKNPIRTSYNQKLQCFLLATNKSILHGVTDLSSLLHHFSQPMTSKEKDPQSLSDSLLTQDIPKSVTMISCKNKMCYNTELKIASKVLAVLALN